MAKSVAIHVGISDLDPVVYPTAKHLLSPPLDARGMYNLARGFGYTPLDLSARGPWDGTLPAPPNVFLNGAATYENVVAAFQSAAALLRDAGDRCFITLSSHGTQVRNMEQGPNLDGLFDETVCLHDYPLRDDVIHGLLAQFEPEVNVILVLDCCHAGATSVSGGVVESLKKVVDAFFGFFGRSRSSSALEMAPVSSSRKLPYGLGIPKVTTKPAVAAPPLAVTLESQFRDFGQPSLRANVLVFQACGADELTFDGAKPGDCSVYSTKFIVAANSRPSLGNLITAIAAAAPRIPNCTPQTRHTGTFDLTMRI